MITAVTVPVVIQGGPNWAEWITAISSAILATGVLIAASQLFDTRRTRDAGLAKDMSEQWDGDNLVETRERIRTFDNKTPSEFGVAVESAREAGDDLYYTYVRELNFLEDLGVLYRRRVLNIRLIESALGTVVRERWILWEPYVRAIRGSAHSTYYENFEILAKRLTDRQRPDHRWRRAVIHQLLRRLD